MRAYLFSIGESTTDIARWSLERLGYDVVMLSHPTTTFYEKYVEFLDFASRADDEAVLRCDADVIATKRLMDLQFLFHNLRDDGMWWIHGQTYCHLKHDLVYGGHNFITREGINIAQRHIREFERDSRPESRITRAPEMYAPRRFKAVDMVTGIHGYRQRPQDIARVMAQKERRGQMPSWDMELLEKMKSLT